LFEFLVRQFKRVGDPKDPHQSEYYYIVDSLATVKSIVLVCDLESGSEQLIEQIFKESFDAISRNSPKNVEIALSDILLSLIEELPSLPHPVIEILVSFFQTKTERSRPAAFDLAVEVCKGASDKLQRYVSQYFAGVIQAAIEGRKDSDFEDQSSESEDEHTGSRRNSRNTGARPKGTSRGKVRESTGKGSIDVPEGLVSAHSMIESLNRLAPSLLLNVIPLLSSELTSTASSEYRRLATTCLGGMFAENSASGDLAASFPLVWKEWMKRTADVTPTVRIAVADSLRKIWSRHAELGSDVEGRCGSLLAITE
jgi:sister-chromatid-cohesion protein PDS5